MNEDVGECICVGHNGERGMDLILPLGQENSLAIIIKGLVLMLVWGETGILDYL